MQEGFTILPSHEINAVKWNACVASHENGLIYAHTHYLNTMCDHWSGIVMNDYQAIMPLPWKMKYGIRYLYTPPFMQQLGIIGKGEIQVEAWQHAVVSFCSYGDCLLNYSNGSLFTKGNLKACNNFIIDLSHTQAAIQSNYKKSFKEALHRAQKKELLYGKVTNAAEIIALSQQYNAPHLPHVTAQDYHNLAQLCANDVASKIIMRKVYDKTQNLLSAVLLLQDEKRLYNLLNYTSPEGRKLEANYFLYHQLWAEFAESPLLFDFEGSDLTGVQRFYERSGAFNQPYYHWHFNQLPWPLRWLKR